MKESRTLFQICDSMDRDALEDRRKRAQLVDMLTQLRDLAQPYSGDGASHKFVKDFLMNDGTTQDIVKDCDSRIDELGNDETVILVAGKTKVKINSACV